MEQIKVFTPELGFDPEKFGVDVTTGCVDGLYLGVLSATACRDLSSEALVATAVKASRSFWNPGFSY